MGKLILILGCMYSSKCLGKDTGVLMFDGTIKKVQYIKKGDLLMGDDSTPRKVLEITRGFGKLYKVIPSFGEPWPSTCQVWRLGRLLRTRPWLGPTWTPDLGRLAFHLPKEW